MKKFFNPFPKYLQLREILRKRMQSGYEVGDRLPTEDALCKEFAVSRETVREALRSFEDEGVIVRRQGQGTFLARRFEERGEQRLTGMSEDYTALKLNTTSKLIKSGIVALPEISRLIESNSDEVFVVKRVRFFEQSPLALHYAYFTPDIGDTIKHVDFEVVSILNLIETELKIPFFEEKQRIEALIASPELSELLDISVGAPVLFLSRFFRMQDNTPLVLFHSYYRADRYYYSLNIADLPRSKTRKAASPPRASKAKPARKAAGAS
ncbi:GntR family transcriptional regulator [Bordetella sp. BOR01]|uniref:GntR family transcriptional regulator n=1 Tax=Bordetella sp. BOR01 TaxID=2854779 RepID=UPI001C45F8CE|nr:GntR family transcriptional regulator [Bordetella sp. BOR01]MBV7484135.1 GntR family transcriptional regulator [Bordetella sp. BOR01]